MFLETTFARLGRWQALTVLGVIAATAVLFVAVAISQPIGTPRRGGKGDVALYRAEAERIRSGEGYYDAAAAELPARGYPTLSIFNWRTPLPMWLDGTLPWPSSKVILCAFAAVLLVGSFAFLANQGGTATGVIGTLLMTGALMPCVLGDLYVMPVVWAGVLMALSVVLHGLQQRGWAVAAGIGALFMRELAGAFCLVMLLVALYERRWREVGAWLLWIAIYAVFYGVHLSQVLPRIQPDGIAHGEGWLQFGGAGFLIGVAQMNCYLLVLPAWIAALYFVAVLAGVASWPTPGGLRAGLAISAYVVLFGLFGQPFNQYWGAMLAPLFCLGAAWFPAATRDLLRAATGPSHSSIARSTAPAVPAHCLKAPPSR